jgi:hypothetical protein
MDMLTIILVAFCVLVLAGVIGFLGWLVFAQKRDLIAFYDAKQHEHLNMIRDLQEQNLALVNRLGDYQHYRTGGMADTPEEVMAPVPLTPELLEVREKETAVMNWMSHKFPAYTG